MKKLITVAALSFSLAFAFALANADDNPTTAETNTPSMDQSPGQAAGETGMPSRDSEMTDTSKTDTSKMDETTKSKEQRQAAQEKRWRQAKSCTDKEGITYKRGQPGFEQCVQAKIEQLGGEIGTETEKQTTEKSTTERSEAPSTPETSK